MTRAALVFWTCLIFVLAPLKATVITDDFDGDNDYIPDQLENELAKENIPALFLGSLEDVNRFYPTLDYNIPFSADLYVEEGTRKLIIALTFGVLFTRDTGITC